MTSIYSDNLIVRSVFDQNINYVRRDLHRSKYKIAELFWAYLILTFISDRGNFKHKINGLLVLHSELFFHTLESVYNSLEKFNGLDRDVLNTHRGNKTIFSTIFKEQLDIKTELYQYLIQIINSLKTTNKPRALNSTIASHPQPYLPRCEQVLLYMTKYSNVEITESVFDWPFQKLSKSILKKLQETGDKIFYHTILEVVAGELIKFDQSGGMNFSAFIKVNSEIDAVYDYMPRYPNYLRLDNPQLGFRITTKYRNMQGQQLNPETVNRNIRRYYESAEL